jgi:hypothetical protein
MQAGAQWKTGGLTHAKTPFFNNLYLNLLTASGLGSWNYF